jgi:hypothetical protein
MGPRDPIERELLRQQGDPLVLVEDAGWLKIAGARAVAQVIPVDVDAYAAWLRSEPALEGVEDWLRMRMELRQRVDPGVPPWRDQVRWCMEYALLMGPGDPHRQVYLSERSITRAVETHDRKEEAEYRRLKALGKTDFVTGPIHWHWILEWVAEHLPFPEGPASQSSES